MSLKKNMMLMFYDDEDEDEDEDVLCSYVVYTETFPSFLV